METSKFGPHKGQHREKENVDLQRMVTPDEFFEVESTNCTSNFNSAVKTTGSSFNLKTTASSFNLHQLDHSVIQEEDASLDEQFCCKRVAYGESDFGSWSNENEYSYVGEWYGFERHGYGKMTLADAT